MKKILALVACLSLVASLAIGGSIAYLTDRESAANIFTLGDVKIDLSEIFEENTALLPGKVIEKTPIIENIGENEAYVWATIAYPVAFNKVKDLIVLDQTTSENWEAYQEIGQGMTQIGAPTEGKKQTINGVDCVVFTYLYKNPLKNGDKTTPLMTSVKLNEFVDVDPNGELYYVKGGQTEQLGWNLSNGGPVIYVSAYAIQKEGFDNVKKAYAAYTQQWGENGGFEYDENTTDNVMEIADAAALAAAFAGDLENATLNLAEGDYGVINISGNVENVNIYGASDSNIEFNILSSAVVKNVTFKNLDTHNVQDSGSYVDGGIVNIDAGATVKNLVIENSNLTGEGGRSAIVGISEPSAEVIIRDCYIDGTKYIAYASAPISQMTIENCEIKNIDSWVAMMNAGDSVGAKLTISGNTFTNCTGGVAKYLGSSQPEGAFTVFTNNKLDAACTGHDGSDAKWFTIPGASSTITVSGNTLDGAEWIPSVAQGLGK